MHRGLTLGIVLCWLFETGIDPQQYPNLMSVCSDVDDILALSRMTTKGFWARWKARHLASPDHSISANSGA